MIVLILKNADTSLRMMKSGGDLIFEDVPRVVNLDGGANLDLVATSLAFFNVGVYLQRGWCLIVVSKGSHLLSFFLFNRLITCDKRRLSQVKSLACL